MSVRKDLPPVVSGRSFRVGEARDAGVPARRLDASDLAAPMRGVRTPTGAPLLDAVSALLSEGQAFTGPTAAKLWGIPLPRLWHDDERLWVSTLSRNWTMRRDGVVASRRSSGVDLRRSGHAVLDPARTWASLGSLLEPHDLVAAADRIITSAPRHSALATRNDLELAAAASTRAARVLRAALTEARDGAWSRPESLLRVALVRAGLPEPRLNEPTPVGGGRVAIPDLAWPEYMVCAEYDGRWHDDRLRRAADLERHELLVDAGWLVTHIHAPDLFPEPLSAVGRILRRLTSRGYRHGRRVERSPTTSWLP